MCYDMFLIRSDELILSFNKRIYLVIIGDLNMFLTFYVVN